MTMSDMKIIRLVKRDCCSGRVEEVCEEIEGMEMKTERVGGEEV